MVNYIVLNICYANFLIFIKICLYFVQKKLINLIKINFIKIYE